jgi:hypothetical protein
MVWSGFSPYHGLWYEVAPTGRTGIIPTPWTKASALSFGILAPQPKQ